MHRCKFAEIPARRKGHKSDEELLRESPHVTPDGSFTFRQSRKTSWSSSSGGKHRHSVFLPMWTGRNTLCVIKRDWVAWSTGVMKMRQIIVRIEDP